MAAAELEVARNLKAASERGSGLLTLTIKDKGALFQAYPASGRHWRAVQRVDRGATQKKIETHLAGALPGDKPTHTM